MINEYDFLVFKYADCNKNENNKFEENIPKELDNTNRFCDEDINKFCLILLKVIHKSTWIVTRDSVEYHCLQRSNTILT